MAKQAKIAEQEPDLIRSIEDLPGERPIERKAKPVPPAAVLLKRVKLKCPVCGQPLRVEAKVTPRTKTNYIMAVCSLLPGHYRLFVKGFYKPLKWTDPLACPVCHYNIKYEIKKKPLTDREYLRLSCNNTCSKGFSFADEVETAIDKKYKQIEDRDRAKAEREAHWR